MRKEYLKDIANQSLQIAMRSLDLAFDDTSLSEEDKQYILDYIDKEADKYITKIKDDKMLEFHATKDLVNYCNDKELL